MRHQRIARFLESNSVQIEVLKNFDGSLPWGDTVLLINNKIVSEVSSPQGLREALKSNLPDLGSIIIENIVQISRGMSVVEWY